MELVCRRCIPLPFRTASKVILTRPSPRTLRPHQTLVYTGHRHQQRLLSSQPKFSDSGPIFRRSWIPTLLGAAALSFGWLWSHIVYAEGPDDLRAIRLAEVREHGRNADRFWVVKGKMVYDITDWVPNHPGGDVILRAAGGNIDNYWKIFSIHQKPEVYDILEQYLIGFVDPRDLVDGQVPAEAIDDPFQFDPARDPRLKIHTARPCNAETQPSELCDDVTPNDVFYVRNHLWVPKLQQEEDHEIAIEFPNGEEKKYTLGELRKKFQEHTVTSVLQCSGNRRAHMSAGSRPAQGLQWGVGAIGNAQWTGVRLCDVLKDAGFPTDDLPDDVEHAQFSGAEAYGASVPIEKAVDKRGDVLLAYKMNGETLPRDHGYPLRVIVPGHVAARSVKWLNRITLSDEESQSQWQQRDYKCFGPYQGPNVEWEKAPAIQETPVQSAITKTRDLTSADSKVLEVYGLESDGVQLEGYAYSGGGRRIVRVDVSADGGRTWREASLLEGCPKGHKSWGWRRWRICIPKDQVGREFAVKAVDEANNVQPEHHEPHWNFRGNLTTAWQREPYDRPR